MSSGIPGPSESSSSHRYAAARVFYMDSLRAVLMSLGVALHAAMVYDTSREWVISDPSGSPAFGIVIALIHLFRMPVFVGSPGTELEFAL